MRDPIEKTNDEKREQLLAILKKSRFAFFVSQGSSKLHGRPMATAKIGDDPWTTIWFSTHRTSITVEELEANPEVLLCYSHGSTEWATLNGRARIVDDRIKIRQLYSKLWDEWFDGPEDSNLVLIEVTPSHAEYWDSGNKLVMWTKFALGALRGKHINEGEHAHVAMSGR